MSDKKGNKFFKSSEELISMFLGLAIVLVVGGIIFNYYQKKRGNVEVPGVSDYVSIDEISGKLNKDASPTIVDSNQLAKVGEEGKGEVSKSSNDKKEYTVKRGDSLWKIAKITYGNGEKWTSIAKENGIKTPNIIHSGLVLKLSEISDKGVVAENRSEKTVEISQYKVLRGDSLWKIAVKNCADGFVWRDIWNLNHGSISNPGLIEIGMNLNIPANCKEMSKLTSLKR